MSVSLGWTFSSSPEILSVHGIIGSPAALMLQFGSLIQFFCFGTRIWGWGSISVGQREQETFKDDLDSQGRL